MGVHCSKNSSSDLDYLARQFDKDLGSLHDVDRLSAVEKIIDEHNAALDAQREQLKKTDTELGSLDAMIEEANGKLRVAEAAAHLQAQREQHESRFERLQEEEIKQD